jgi:hypothetical protein
LGKKKCQDKKVNEHEQRVNVKKGASIKKEIKSCTHIHIIYKQKNEVHKKCIIKDVVEM